MKIELIPIDSILVEDRGRIEFGAVGELAESIRTKGLLHPLIIDENNRLIAGERRLRALTLLKHTLVPVQRFNELDELTKVEIELEENTRRKNLSWQEESSLIAKSVGLRRLNDPSYTLDNDPLLDKMKESTLKENLFLSRMMERHPEIINEKDKKNAVRKAKRLQEKELRTLIVKASGNSTPETNSDVGIPTFSTNGVMLVNQDCLEGIRSLPSDSIDLILTDFPFGVDLGNNTEFNKHWEEIYSDSTQHLLTKLLPELCIEFHRVLKDGAHFYIFYPSMFHVEFFAEFTKLLKVQRIPLIWNKRTGGNSFAPYTYYAPNYEPILYGWKGSTPRKLHAPGYCVLNFDSIHGSSKTHPAEKPLELMNYLIQQSTIEGETVLETFSGSGVVAESCVRMDRKCIAYELSPQWYELAVERIMNRVKGGNNA